MKMKITYSLDQDYKTGEHLIFKVNMTEGFGWDDDDEVQIGKVGTYEEAMTFIKELAKKVGDVYLMELPNNCWLHIDKDGNVVESNFEYDRDYELLAKWSGKEYEEHEHVNCRACGDGGCPHCEPHRFVEGYRY